LGDTGLDGRTGIFFKEGGYEDVDLLLIPFHY
jgi:hypothetical protein